MQTKGSIPSGKVNPAIFKAYDIRGVYPKELNEDEAYLLGKAFVRYLKPKEVVIGRDTHLSSEALWKSIAAGLLRLVQM